MKRSKPEQTRLMLQAWMIVVVGLALFLVLYLPPYGWEATIPSAQTANEDPRLAADKVVVATESSLTFEQMETYLAELKTKSPGRDPFLSAGETQWKIYLGELKDRPPRLAGIMNIEGTPVALIQGSHYRIGDTIHDFLVQDIQDNAVVFLKNDKEFIVPLTP